MNKFLFYFFIFFGGIMEFTDDQINEFKSFFLSDSLAQEEVYHYIKKMLIDSFRLSNVSKTPHFKIISFLVFNYMVGIENIHISYIKKKIGLCGKKLNNTLRMLRAKGFITATTDRTIQLSPTIINTIFNLIYQMQNSNLKNLEFVEYLEDKITRLRDLKKIARDLLKDKNYLSYFEKDMLSKLLDAYVFLANNLKLVFKRKDVEELGDNDILIIDYKTRFNSYGVIAKKIRDLEEIISNASKRYPYAIFLTLTTDINKFSSVLDAYKEINKNWNRLITAISKRLGYRPKYIKCLEFHKNGNPHLHILLFVDRVKKNGEWILKQNWVSEMWDKYGQGKIVYLFALKSNGHTYTWLNGRPKGTKSDNITTYLSKYLKKAFNDNLELALFWVSNLRFYTYSRGLKESVKKVSKGIWEFVGVVKEDLLAEFIEELKQKLEVKKDINNKYRYNYIRDWLTELNGIYRLWVV